MMSDLKFAKLGEKRIFLVQRRVKGININFIQKESTIMKLLLSEMREKKKDLDQTETVIRVSERKVILRCEACGRTQEFPTHCGEPMELKNEAFSCIFANCREEKPIIKHCDKPMQIMIV